MVHGILDMTAGTPCPQLSTALLGTILCRNTLTMHAMTDVKDRLHPNGTLHIRAAVTELCLEFILHSATIHYDVLG
jgi:hypothetical protein